jgi:endonuclease V-like protein UPF0215 family
MAARRPHLIGIDDGPFEKGVDRETPVVAVFMEAADRVEGVAITRFAVDGADVTRFLAEWVGSLRFHRAAQGVVLGGVTVAGLAVVDPHALARALELPVLVVNRRPPRNERVGAALASAGLAERRAVLERGPDAFRLRDGLWVSPAGVDADSARDLLLPALGKASVPEPLRLAHMIAAAVARGSSRGRS